MARIAIVGAGAIGCAVGAALIEGGHDVVFCVRQPFARVEIEMLGAWRRSYPARVATDPAALPAVDWALLCVKAHQSESARDWLAAVVPPGGRVAVLQNGVEQREAVAPYVPADAGIVPVVVDIPAARLSPGQVRFRERANMVVQDDAPGRDFCALFAGSFANASTDPDLRTRAWMKLCVNAPGAILALTGQTMAVFHKPGIADLARAILTECVAVGRAEGAVLDEALIDRQVAAFLGAAPDEGNSIHADRMAGKKMEWSARNGVIVRKGRQHGIVTPASDVVTALLAALDPPA